MITIYKYSSPVMDEVAIAVPKGADLLDVQDQYDQLAFWFMVDSTAPTVPRTYLVYGTGHQVRVGSTGAYVTTVQQFNGQLVWHIFEKVSP